MHNKSTLKDEFVHFMFLLCIKKRRDPMTVPCGNIEKCIYK